MKKKQGFTLIELMLVVTIIGMLAAVAIPQYSQYLERSDGANVGNAVQSINSKMIGCVQLGIDCSGASFEVMHALQTLDPAAASITITQNTSVTITFANTICSVTVTIDVHGSASYTIVNGVGITAGNNCSDWIKL